MTAGASIRSRTRQKPATLYRTDDGVLKMEAERSVERWGQVDNPSGLLPAMTERLPELPLPGRGDPYDDCGDPLPARFCRDCGKPVWAGRTCGRSTCPRCWKAWVRDRTVSVAGKLEGLRRFREAQAGDRWTGLKFHHLSFSPADDFAMRGDRPLERAKEIVKVLCNEIGAETGVLIYHPYRLDEDEKADIYAEDDDGLTWAGVLDDGTDMEDIRGHLSHEPHFHAIVLSRYVTGGEMTKAIEDKCGWVIDRHTKRGSSVSIGNAYDLAKATGYSLSHSGLRTTDSGRTQAGYWYFGEVANFRPTEGVKDDIRNCFAAVSETILGERFAGVAGTVIEGEPDTDTEGHRHRNVPISRAHRYLKNGRWRDRARHVGELRTAVNYLAAMRPKPALPPPDPPPE